MALVKVAYSVCPCEDLGQYQRAIDWLMGRGRSLLKVPGPVRSHAGSDQ
jgi:hypothetical protein